MVPLPLTINKTGYSFTTILGEQYEKPFGGFLIDFLDTDFSQMFHEIDVLSDELSYVARDNDDLLNDYYDALSYKLALDRVYNPVLCQLVINEIDKTERSYFTSGQGYSDNELIQKLENLQGFFPTLQPVVSEILENSSGRMSEELIIFYNHLALFQNIQTYYNVSPTGFIQIHTLQDVVSLLSLELYQVQFNNVLITKCRNCGRFFIPSIRSDEKYCDRIFKDGKTCKDVGYSLNTDEFQRAYRSAYKTQKSRCLYYRDANPNYVQQHFNPWQEAALQAKREYQSKNDLEGFKKWLKDNKNSF